MENHSISRTCAREMSTRYVHDTTTSSRLHTNSIRPSIRGQREENVYDQIDDMAIYTDISDQEEYVNVPNSTSLRRNVAPYMAPQIYINERGEYPLYDNTR